MNYVPQPPQEPGSRKTRWALLGLSGGFLALGAAMLANLWGQPAPLRRIPLVDPAFLDQTASRKSYADLVRDKADLSDFKCYVCHEKKNPPPLRFDAQHNLVVPVEHELGLTALPLAHTVRRCRLPPVITFAYA